MEKDDGPTLEAEDLERRERAAARGELEDGDAPTDAEENEGMSSVLSADPVTGVQDDTAEE